MTQHKPTLYIGIGGTGCHILSMIKKHFEDEFGQGNIPDYIRFLAIDTELSCIEELRECYYRLNLDRTSSLKYLDTFVKYENPGLYNCFSDSRHELIGASCGTGANRAWGRLLLEMESIRLFHRCREILHQLYYQNSFCRKVEVRMLMSLAGGTGSGIFIPLAAALAQIKGPDIYGYAVMPNAFCHSSFATRILERTFESNTFASILELDYVQHASASNPVAIKVCGQVINICTPPFRDVCFVENISASGIVIKDRRDLFRAIALSAYSSSFNTKHDDIPDWIEDRFSIANKKAWVRCIGVCEVVYKGEAMAELWSYMAAKEILYALLNKTDGSTVDKYVFEFRDMYDMKTLDDFLARISIHYPDLSSNSDFVPRTTAAKDLRYEVDEYIDISLLSNNIKDMECQFYDASLYDFVSGVLNDTHSIDAACEFLKILKYTIQTDQQELELLSSSLKNDILKYQTSLSQVLDDYQNRSTFFLKILNRRVTADFISDIFYCAEKVRCAKLAVLRNEIAYDIYSKLISDIEKLNQQFHIADDVNKTLYSIEKWIPQLKEECHASAPFLCNVTFSVADSLERCLDDAVINDFWRNFCFQKVSSPEKLAEDVLSYTRNLQQAKEYRTKTLSSVISSMSQEQYEYIKDFIKNNVSRLLMLNYKGYCSTIPLLIKEVGLCCSEETRLDNDFKSILGYYNDINRNISSSLTQKMIISISERYLLPIFCESLPYGKSDGVFNDFDRNSHIDAMWYEEMQKIGFSLMPKQDEYLIVDDEQVPQENIKQDPVPEHEIMRHGKHRRKYDVFISSKSEDYAYAEQVYDFLTEKGFSVFLACRELKKIGNSQYSVAIDDALDETEHMIVICSSARYAHSKWVRYEWSTFDNDKKSGYRNGNLIVILFPEVEQKDLPPALRHQEHIMFAEYKESVLFYLTLEEL